MSKREPFRWWVSWVQPTEDYRPLNDPPNVQVCGWWCSGSDSDDNAILCAVVDEYTEDAVISRIHRDWPEARVPLRFIECKDREFVPGDRFPVDADWMRQRLEGPRKLREALRR